MFTKGLYDENIILAMKVDKSEEGNIELSTSINEKEAILSELELEIRSFEETSLIYESKNRELEDELQQLKDELHELNETFERVNDWYNTLLINYEELASDVAETNQAFIYDQKLIRISQKEEDVLELFGEPLAENIEINGTGIWYFEGRYTKISNYEDIVVGYIGDKNGENYVVAFVTAITNNVITLRNVRVGNTLESLLTTYPMLYKAEWIEDEEVYMWGVAEFRGHIMFTIVDGIVVEIEISRSYT